MGRMKRGEAVHSTSMHESPHSPRLISECSLAVDSALFGFGVKTVTREVQNIFVMMWSAFSECQLPAMR